MMMQLMRQRERLLLWFISGLIVVIMVAWTQVQQQPAIATATTQANAIAIDSDFAASHLEPNFYQ